MLKVGFLIVSIYEIVCHILTSSLWCHLPFEFETSNTHCPGKLNLSINTSISSLWSLAENTFGALFPSKLKACSEASLLTDQWPTSRGLRLFTRRFPVKTFSSFNHWACVFPLNGTIKCDFFISLIQKTTLKPLKNSYDHHIWGWAKWLPNNINNKDNWSRTGALFESSLVCVQLIRCQSRNESCPWCNDSFKGLG